MPSLAAAVATQTYRPANDAGEDLMQRFGVRMVFADGEDIFAQDEPADLLYRLVSGTVRTTRLARDGRRQIGDFHQPGDLFGLEQSPRHRFSAEALGACEVLVARRRAMARFNDAVKLELPADAPSRQSIDKVKSFSGAVCEPQPTQAQREPQKPRHAPSSGGGAGDDPAGRADVPDPDRCGRPARRGHVRRRARDRARIRHAPP